MTQEEYKEAARKKADELIEKFSVFANGEIESQVEKHNSIQCAKILAQQILDLDVVWYRKRAIGKPDFIRAEMTREFWEEVMKELNK
ncbi:hypothetical protein [Petrimonas sulfuriphila]|uniref:hypothetical protein n=1 Tax=Petrimonas sulfuriphila TaxID=285070 RepID=UPI003EC043C9